MSKGLEVFKKIPQTAAVSYGLKPVSELSATRNLPADYNNACSCELNGCGGKKSQQKTPPKPRKTYIKRHYFLTAIFFREKEKRSQ